MRKNPEIGSLSNSHEPECPKRFDGVLVENGRPLTDDSDVQCLGETERLSQKAYSEGGLGKGKKLIVPPRYVLLQSIIANPEITFRLLLFQFVILVQLVGLVLGPISTDIG